MTVYVVIQSWSTARPPTYRVRGVYGSQEAAEAAGEAWGRERLPGDGEARWEPRVDHSELVLFRGWPYPTYITLWPVEVSNFSPPHSD